MTAHAIPVAPAKARRPWVVHSILPGFGLSLGITLAYLGAIVVLAHEGLEEHDMLVLEEASNILATELLRERSVAEVEARSHGDLIQNLMAADLESEGLEERAGLLGPDVQLVHPLLTTAEERAILKARGVSYSTSPQLEARRSSQLGVIQLGELLEAGVKVSLSTDHVASTSCDPFGAMRTLFALHSHRIGTRMPLTLKRLPSRVTTTSSGWASATSTAD